ncbi:hypothetical protein SAMD00020551_0499 [Mesobacillus selenatarsenatis SF-1]|uniref:Uncharacterized protein n=1 Tax=Mesobacillus selenatarsenatis (strain DSM 18680 / JCM 14380 / FERM P-15431 / SF-1) TaxID=1321606 RepID=A0A0A8X2N0_MESS1|nr:hypothetical protein SAMD00020551_0499 [Mesobacillus selenatarsenatis SF-1]
MFFISCIFVYSTVFFDGKMIKTYDELKESFPMVIGFPIGFVELTVVNIDPPLPYFYGINVVEQYGIKISSYFQF